VTLFTYTAMGQVATKTTPKGTTSYAYDNRQRLVSVTEPDPDGAGPLAAPVTSFTYDDEGNRLSKANIATGELVEYTWDHRNRLTGIVTKDSLGIVTHEVQYTYDIFNRRIVKTIDADGAGSGAPLQEIYIYDGLREERGNAGDHILLRFDEAENLTGRYLHGPNVDQILASEDVTSPSVAGDVLWALTDHLGSVRDLAEYDSGTDTTSVANHIVYDAYGQIISESNSAVDFLYGFTGRERDTESDLQYNRARYYDATIGRWMSQDPVGFDAGDTNLYRYVENQPAILRDPTGLTDEVSSELQAIQEETRRIDAQINQNNVQISRLTRPEELQEKKGLQRQNDQLRRDKKLAREWEKRIREKVKNNENRGGGGRRGGGRAVRCIGGVIWVLEAAEILIDPIEYWKKETKPLGQRPSLIMTPVGPLANPECGQGLLGGPRTI